MTTPRIESGQMLDLRRAGVTVATIADRAGLTSAEVTDALDAALAAVPLAVDVRLELDRLDRMLAGCWTAAARGDVAEVDRVLRISERRSQLARVLSPGEGDLEQAFDRTVAAYKAAELRPPDALVVLGQRLARWLDAVLTDGTTDQAMRAARLVPVLAGLIRDLRAGSDVLTGDGSRVEPTEDDPDQTGVAAADAEAAGVTDLAAIRQQYDRTKGRP